MRFLSRQDRIDKSSPRSDSCPVGTAAAVINDRFCSVPTRQKQRTLISMRTSPPVPSGQNHEDRQAGGRAPTEHGHDVNSPIIICAGMHICLSQSKTIIGQVRSWSRRDRIAKVIAPIRFLSHRGKIQVADCNLRLDSYLFHTIVLLQK